uniref:Uncharacterized protein n=1 Tax=Brassica oleracea TaxID=3712 RepID=A0A3P6F9Q3_BRAOL|nr:unnamed protein product [Brassica oleracea]
MNRYGASFKFLDDEVIKSPSCLYGHDYLIDFEGSYLKYSSMLYVFSHYTFSIHYTFDINLKYSNTVSIRRP